MSMLHTVVGRSPWTLAFVALALVSCVENRSSVTITHNAVMASDCVVSGTDTAFRSMGTLDVGAAAMSCYLPEYVMFPMVENNLLSTEATGAIETNYVEIVEARINLDLGAMGDSFEDLRFKYPAFKTLAPGEAAPLEVVVIPHQYAQLFASYVQSTGEQPIIRVKLKFMYQHGGYEHETHEIEYPIKLCAGCLIFETNIACNSGLVDPGWPKGNQCLLTNAQDEQVYCCTDPASACPVCPAVDTSTTTE
ncbi:MAG: hypothetical protein ABI333_11790 [bacterium]